MLTRSPTGRRYARRTKAVGVVVLVLASATAAGFAFAGTIKKCNKITGICTVVAYNPGSDGDDGDRQDGDYYCDEDRGCTTGADDDPCYYRLAVPQPDLSDPIWGGHTTGAIYMQSCGEPGGPTGMGGRVWFAEPPDLPSPAVLASRAMSQLQVLAPAIGTAPSPDGSGLVGLPVWLWTVPGLPFWGTATATASVPGLSVTVTATATQIVWNMGDGNTVTCTNPGTPYDPSFGNTESKTCGHRYLVKSPPGGYPVTATTTWQIAWSGGGASGGQTLTLQSATTVNINELQVVTS